jgi:hypothetical protein
MSTKPNPVREALDERLDSLNNKTVKLDGQIVARVFTVAAMGNWTPAVDDPFESIVGEVEVNFRIIAEAYAVAIMSGWQPEEGDPVAAKLKELGLLQSNGSTE